jgi:hypothetical protein
MNCKKCGITVGPIPADETTRQIKAIFQGIGAEGLVLESMLTLYAPLCRQCMQHWGSGEDALTPSLAANS